MTAGTEADTSRGSQTSGESREADVFTAVLDRHRPFFRDAAVAAAWDLGVFEEASRLPSTPSVLASGMASRSAVMETLLAVLACEGCLVYDRAAGVYSGMRPPKERPDVPGCGLGRLAGVVRGTVGPEDCAFACEPGIGPLHDHLYQVGLPAAVGMWETLQPEGGRLLDVGCGAGAYAAAYLEQYPESRVTLVDRAGVLELARRRLAAHDDRVSFEPCDALASLPGNHDVLLVANLLHLYDPKDAQILLANAYSALRPGGRLVIKDMWMNDDRMGPPIALYFALTLAVYTAGGDVHEPRRVCRWAKEQGFSNVAARRFESSLLVTGVR
jgi:ubiquinone/menaquinone biosynthesis C-methylase UbiE